MFNRVPKYRRWTASAVECYSRRCVCDGCITGQILKSATCRMKITVRDLVKRFGPPPKTLNLIPGATQHEENIIAAILEGAESLKQIAESVELTQETIKHRLCSLYRLVEDQGYQFKIPTSRDRLAEFIEYVKKLQAQNDTSDQNIILDEETEKKGNSIMYDKDLNLEYPNFMAPIIDAMKKGHETVADIANVSGVGRVSVSVAINQLATRLVDLKLISLNKDIKTRQIVFNFIQSRLLDPEYKEEINTPSLPVDKVEENTIVTNSEVDLTAKNKTENNTDYTALIKENEQLRKRITELENKSQPAVKCDLSSVKAKINQDIMLLTQKLKLVEELEKDLM